MPNKPVAVILGGTNPHKALIENLKNRGYYTILVDYYENPTAKVAADKHIKESALDLEKVLCIAKESKAKLVISTCIDQAGLTACYVAEQLGLPAPYSYQTALNVTNKVLMKKKMIENGIPTAKYISVNSIEKFYEAGFKLPVVVKPADCNGSKGVKKANTFLEIEKFLKDALVLSRTATAIVEEFKTGIEISVDCFVEKNNARVIMMRQKFNTLGTKDTVIHCYASVVPALVSDQAMSLIKKTADNIAKVFNLENTPLLMQVIVDANNVNVIEFAPRVGGGLSYRTVKINTGFDILNSAVDSYLGNLSKVRWHPPKMFCSTNNIYADACTFGNITGYEELLRDDFIEEIYFYKTRGMTIGSDMASNTRAGAFLVKADTAQELLEKTKKAIDTLEVFDLSGNPVMKKNFYVKELPICM